jgi:hypothetical protein
MMREGSINVAKEKVISRLRIKASCKDKVSSLLLSMDIAAINVKERDNGDCTFEFGRQKDEKLLTLIDSIPKECFALTAVIHSN